MQETYMQITKQSQFEKATYCRFQLYDILEKSGLWSQKKEQWLPGLGEGSDELVAEGIFRAEKPLCLTPYGSCNVQHEEWTQGSGVDFGVIW